MEKRILIFIICICVLIIPLSIAIFCLKNDTSNSNSISSEKETNDAIDFYTIKSAPEFKYRSIYNTQYKITNEEELEMFYELYDEFEFEKQCDFDKSTLFVETCTYDESVDWYFKNVNINEKVEFDIETNEPEYSLDAFSYYFNVATIPNNMLEGVNTDDWRSPIDVDNEFKDLYTEYTIHINSNDLDFEDSLSIIEENINDIGNILLTSYEQATYLESYLSDASGSYYSLTSYDEEATNKLLENIDNLGNGMNAYIAGEYYKEREEADYQEFKNKLNEMPTQYYEIELTAASKGLDFYESGKSEEIVQMLNPDETNDDTHGTEDVGLGLVFNEFDIEQLKTNVDIVSEHQTEWNLSKYYVMIYWKYNSTDEA